MQAIRTTCVHTRAPAGSGASHTPVNAHSGLRTLRSTSRYVEVPLLLVTSVDARLQKAQAQSGAVLPQATLSRLLYASTGEGA